MDLLDNQFFACFGNSGAQALAKCVETQSQPAGITLFEEGESADGVYLVVDGEVSLSKDSNHQHVEIAVVRPGEYFGEVGILDGGPRSARATMKTAGRVAKIPGSKVLEVLKAEPSEVTLRFFDRLLAQLRATTDQFVKEAVRKEKLHAIGEMSASIIHDFNNPITTINISASLIAKNHKDPKTEQWADIIVKQSQRMVMMIRELLDFTRGKVVLNPRVISVSGLVTEFEELNRELFKSYPSVQVIIEPSPFSIRVDLHRMLRVLQNLVMNAIQAMGIEKGEVRIFAREKGSFVELCIQDNGPGIPPQIHETLFQPFVTYGKKNGTGLGLSIVKMVVEAHQGEITFESTVGKGTTFIIRLPKVS
jgi:signal transduction histidine kinase